MGIRVVYKSMDTVGGHRQSTVERGRLKEMKEVEMKERLKEIQSTYHGQSTVERDQAVLLRVSWRVTVWGGYGRLGGEGYGQRHCIAILRVNCR